MTTVAWSADDNYWVATIETPAYGPLEVLITTDGQETPPSEKQHAILAQIAALSDSVRETISAEARRYAEEYLGEDGAGNLEDDAWDLEFHMALIPNLQQCEDAYFFLAGDSDAIDPEHGIACLCKNGTTFRVCHPDNMYEYLSEDDLGSLEQLLKNG